MRTAPHPLCSHHTHSTPPFQSVRPEASKEKKPTETHFTLTPPLYDPRAHTHTHTRTIASTFTHTHAHTRTHTHTSSSSSSSLTWRTRSRVRSARYVLFGFLDYIIDREVFHERERAVFLHASSSSSSSCSSSSSSLNESLTIILLVSLSLSLSLFPSLAKSRAGAGLPPGGREQRFIGKDESNR